MDTQRSVGHRAPWRRAVACAAAGLGLVAVSASRWAAAPQSGDGGTPTVAVVVAATDLPAGSVVQAAMLASAPFPAEDAVGLVADRAAVSGRVLAVPLLKGEPLAFGVTLDAPVAASGHRLVRISVGAVDVAPDVAVGAEADLVASYPAGSADAHPTVTVVAVARVVTVERQTDAAALPATADVAQADAPQVGSTLAVTLDCATADALRVLWARDNARVLRLLSHPTGDAPPPAASA